MAEPSSKKYKTGKRSAMRKYTDIKNARSSVRQAIGLPVTNQVVMQAVKKGMLKEAMKNAGYVDFISNAGKFCSGNATPIALLATVPTGSGIQQRVGARIKWKSIQIRGVIGGGTSTANSDRVCILFVYDRKPSAALPGLGEILSTTPSADSLVNDNNRDRFLTLKRIDVKLTGDASNVNGEGFKVVEDYFKLKGLEAEYSGAQLGNPPVLGVGDGGFGDIRTGAIYVLLCGHRTNTPADAPSFWGTIRTRFADIQG